MNENDIRRYARLMTELDLTGMEINVSRGTVRLERAPGISLSESSCAENSTKNTTAAYAAEEADRTGYVSAENREIPGDEPELKENAVCGGPEKSDRGDMPEPKNGMKSIKSPTVGIFYDSPTESSEAFVKVGDHVKKGEVLCIIEAMKLMNEIEAEEDGIVEKICIKSGDQVEYGTELFLISADVA